MRVDKFWSHVQKSEGCWTWTGQFTKGYGRYSSRDAHRVTYELLVGPIPEGLELDHLCRNTACVNPDHLEPVTRAENMRRRAEQQTACKHGHEFTPENTYRLGSRRICRACNAAAARRYQSRRAIA